ncbi:hypothetical protein L1987_84109 [Smallanthus sonchifolius]|uniref:Uncharacterized protein n=1 Tax=Smallanthus sonchifolius TaxID=185202 RepID=A0ACB8YEY3_9ASTR|nr:hypothetical protein L1987_84109 [Smallanthus sonchifolius]
MNNRFGGAKEAAKKAACKLYTGNSEEIREAQTLAAQVVASKKEKKDKSSILCYLSDGHDQQASSPTIIENILCLVPIQKAARTSILSKEWRHRWTTIPKLVFEENKFQVSSNEDEPSALEETFDNIPNLYLISCDLDHQPTFNGFYSLTNLFMECVTITRSTLLHLLFNCPLLKSLTMYTDNIQDIGDSTITNLFECFPVVENLSIWLMVLECFAQNGVPRVLPSALIRLKYLYIDHMNFKYKYGLPFLLCLIRSSPNLETLKLQDPDVTSLQTIDDSTIIELFEC